MSVQIIGVKAVNKRMTDMTKRLQIPKPAMDKSAVLAHKDVMDHFKQSQGSKQQWEGLLSRRGRPLLDTGRLRQSIKFKVLSTGAYVFTNLNYAGYHQFGKDRMHRDFMWLSKKAKTIIVNVINKYVFLGKK